MTSRLNRPVMFRAGAAAGEQPAAPDQAASAAALAPHAATLSLAPKVLLADISEFQPEINDSAYLQWSKAIIIRAAYGSQHDDHAWRGGARRDALHAGGAKFIGCYQYIVAGQDPVRQADVLGGLIGTLRPGEKVIGDFEEGAGSQAHRRDLWAARIGQLGDEPWIYSGLNFAASHGISPVEWVAAYQAAEPAVTHVLWQFSDNFQVPGVGTADCSVFHGTISELAALAYQPEPKPATTEDDMPSGLITSPPGVRETRSWPAGAVSKIVLRSDWEGVQATPPVVDLRIAHKASQPFGAGHRTVDGTDTYVIGSPGDCNGCAFTRIDGGAATVSFHTLP